MKYKTKLIAEIEVLMETPLSSVLAHQLSKYKESIANLASLDELCIANKKFGRFLVDSFNWEDPFFKKCSEIHRMGLNMEHVLREQETGK